jgi:hypothetical protein
VYDAVSAEELNKPSAVIAAHDFATDARSAASGKGLPGLRIVAENVPPECTVDNIRRDGISAAMNDIIGALTQPLTAEEQNPPPKKEEKLARNVFKGDLKEVNQFFYKRGWTDGFPIIPPTEAEVAEMLTGTDLPGDQVVAKIIPRMGKATVEKIAINAVMAGALPTYMPVLIAGVQAAMDPLSHFGTWEVSTGSWIPFWIINGPIRRDLHVNSGQGMFSPGDIANATIGRAMSMIIKNIGGARKGIEDMGIFGNAGKYTMVAGENEEASPWEPLHVQHGYKKEDSTVTVSFPNSVFAPFVFSTDAKGIIRAITSAVHDSTTLILQPQIAKTLGDDGWSKKELAEYISKYAWMPAYRTSSYWRAWVPGRERPAMNPEDPVLALHGPDSIRILVAGGSGGLMVDVATGGSITGNWVTKKVQLPANWNKLVEKYKALVPTHVRY